MLVSMFAVGVARAVDPVAGPMIGHVTDRSARIWMQFPVAGAVTFTAIDVDERATVSVVKVDLEGPLPFTCDVPVNNLLPDHTYRIEIKFDDQPVRLAGG